MPNVIMKRKIIKDPITINDILPDEDENINITSDEEEEVGGVSDSTERQPLPKPIGKNLQFSQAMSYLESLTKSDWEHCICYLYRLFPKIDRKRVNPNNSTNIDKISEPINKQQFVDRYGGGKYRLDINDIDIGKSGRNIARAYFELDWALYPPVINLEELRTEDDTNRAYVTKMVSEGKLDGRTLEPMTPGTKDNGELIGLTRELLNTVVRTNREQITALQNNKGNNSESIELIKLLFSEKDKANAILEERLKDMDPVKQMEMVTNMVTALKGGNGNDSNQLMIEMFKMMNENNKANLEAIKAMVEGLKSNRSEGSSNESKSSVEQIKELIEVSQLIGGGGREVKKSNTEVIIDGIKEIGTPILQTVTGFFLNKMSMPQNGGMPAPINQPPIRHMNGTPIQQPTHHEMPQQPRELTESDMNIQAQQMINQFGQMIISRMDQGETGEVLADWLIEGFGLDSYAMIKNIGENKILEAAKSVPAFWNRTGVLYGEDKVKEYIHDFCNWTPGEDGEENNEVIQ